MNSRPEDVEQRSIAVDREQAELEFSLFAAELKRAGSQRTFTSLIAILIPAILGGTWLAYTVIKVNDLEGRAEKARRDLTATATALGKVQGELTEARSESLRLNEEMAQKRSELEVTKQQLAIATQELENAKIAVQLQLAETGRHVAADRSAATAVKSATKNIEQTFDKASKSISRVPLVEDNRVARLFFFAVDKQQKEKVRAAIPAVESKAQFAKVLNVFAFEAPRDRDVQVRYFRDVDADEAGKTLEVLKETILAPNVPARISRVNDPNSVGTGRKFQVWLTSNALK